MRIHLGIVALGIAGILASAGALTAAPPPAARAPISALRAKGAHLVFPSEAGVERALRRGGKIGPASTEAEIEEARVAYLRNLGRHSRTWATANAAARVRERERALLAPAREGAPRVITPLAATVFCLAVDFGGVDTIDVYTDTGGGCALQSVTTSGPLRGEIPPPGSRDNNTLWYPPSLTRDTAFYENLIFGYAGAGRVRPELTDPRDGLPGINLAGYTMQDYYDYVAGPGNLLIQGTVQGWVRVGHSEGYYGANNCMTGAKYGGAAVPVAQLVIDAVDQFNLANPGFSWPTYDADGDGFVDTFWLIHAGMGEEEGGGAEGEFAIWAHSSDLRNQALWPNGYKVYEGAPGPADDIFVGPYTMQPENCGVGVLAEEFGHNFFDWPDLYTTDYQNSVSFWSNMSAGSWGGYLGGCAPVGMTLWFRMIAWTSAGYTNWQEPMVTRAYNAGPQVVPIGQLEAPPAGAYKGVAVTLPPIQIVTNNNTAGAGQCAYSGQRLDNAERVISRSISVTAPGVLSVDSWWDIEQGWDYGYVTANGALLDDMDAFFTTTNPNGANQGVGLTGSGSGQLRFDLSAFAGGSVTIAFRYVTDSAISNSGWQLDNVRLDGALIDDFGSASEADAAAEAVMFPGWTNSDPGWHVAPLAEDLENYYLVEWRGPTKYDTSVRTAYVTTFTDDDEWQVARVPFQLPGALLYYRNQFYGPNYTLATGDWDDPSAGGKYQLLVVDMNYDRMSLGATGSRLNARSSSYDSPLSLDPTDAFSLPAVQGVSGGPFDFPPKPAIPWFSDEYGYYAGFYVLTPYDGYFYWRAYSDSCVIPASGPYTTRIVNGADGSPAVDYYGWTIGDKEVGTGNPGDAGVAWGVEMELQRQSANGDRGWVRFDYLISPREILRHLMGIEALAPAELALADRDSDGDIDIRDWLMLSQEGAGW